MLCWQPRSQTLALAAAGLVLAAALAGCGGPQGAVVDTTAKPAPVAEAPKEPDAYRDFRGRKVKLGEPFRLAAEAVGVEGGLAAAGLRQFLHGPFKHDLGQRIPQGGVRLLQQGAHRRKSLGKILAHANFLGALTCEKKNCGFGHKQNGIGWTVENERAG